ncbi:MAG: hypothetical protein IKP00_15005 [Victivallales bacterium]|nr:hypothetical protein [Victivallales bacterium]
MQKNFQSSLLVGMLLLWTSEMGLHATLSAPVRIDLRTTTGAQIILRPRFRSLVLIMRIRMSL